MAKVKHFEIEYTITRKGTLVMEDISDAFQGNIGKVEEAAVKVLKRASVVPEDEEATEFHGEKVKGFYITRITSRDAEDL